MKSKNQYMRAVRVLSSVSAFFLILSLIYAVRVGGGATAAVSGVGSAVAAAFASFAAYLVPYGRRTEREISGLEEGADCDRWRWTPAESDLISYWDWEIRRNVRDCRFWPLIGLGEGAFLYFLGSAITRSFMAKGFAVFVASGLTLGLIAGSVRLVALVCKRSRSLKGSSPVYGSATGTYWAGTYIAFAGGGFRLVRAHCLTAHPVLALTMSGEAVTERARFFSPPAVRTLPASTADPEVQSFLIVLRECYGFNDTEGEINGKNEHSMMVGFQ